MKIQYFREFVFLAQTRNFTKTANLLYISQPVLSKHMFCLEEEIGFKLISHTNPMQLTKAGEYFLKGVKPILAELDSVLDKAKRIDGGYTGNLGIGMLYYTKFIITPTVLKFTQRFPHIKHHYWVRTPNEIINAVLDRSVDIGCVMNVIDNADDVLSTFNLYNEPMGIVVGLDHPLAHKKCISIAEVREENFVNINDNYFYGYFNHFNKQVKKYSLSFKPGTLVPTYEDFLLSVQFNQGIGITSRSIKGEVQSRMCYIDLEEDDLFFTRTIIYRKDNKNKAISLFLECCNNFKMPLHK